MKINKHLYFHSQRRLNIFPIRTFNTVSIQIAHTQQPLEEVTIFIFAVMLTLLTPAIQDLDSHTCNKREQQENQNNQMLILLVVIIS